jgi:hypothetical protein
MAFVIKGTEVAHHRGREHKPEVLTGDGERGLRDHAEAIHSIQDRAVRGEGGTVGFADTPAVRAAFASLQGGAGSQEEAGPQQEAGAEPPAETTEALAAGDTHDDEGAAAARRRPRKE